MLMLDLVSVGTEIRALLGQVSVRMRRSGSLLMDA